MDGDERHKGFIPGACTRQRARRAMACGSPALVLAGSSALGAVSDVSGWACSQSWKSKRGGHGVRGEGILDDNVSCRLPRVVCCRSTAIDRG